MIVGCVYQLTKHPACQLGIALTFDRQHNPHGFQSLRADGMRDHLGLITQLKLATADYQPSGAANGLFRAMPNMEVLTLYWPGHEAEHMLMQCMPADRAPICNLHAIIIIAVDMTGMIPGGMPNLRELVISAGGRWPSGAGSCH